MQTWLIYEPPGGAARTLDDAERFVVLREGFHKLAFLAPAIWLLYRRCWMAFALYIAAEVVLALIARGLELRGGSALVFALLPNLAVGFEASWLRARALERRGYSYVASVFARGREEAEAHFFTDWLADQPRETARPQPSGTPYRPAQPAFSFFPQPGAAR